MDRQYIILTDKNSQELLPITNGQAVFVGEGSTKLDEKIQYCLDNRYVLENGLADLDLGYLYWKGIIK